MGITNFSKKNNKPKDYTKYILMYRNGAEQKEIVECLTNDFGIAPTTAAQNYYSKVRTIALRQIEAEKVITGKDEIAPGKFFSERERLRIQKAAGIK